MFYRLGEIRTHNVSGDRYCLHKYLHIQLPNDHDHEGPLRTTELNIVELDTSGKYVIKHHIIKKIENHEFDGKKWEGRGWESKKNFILCGLN